MTGDGCGGDPSVCRREGGYFLGVDWPQCPLRELSADPIVSTVAHLRDAAKRSPIEGWPTTWAAWVPAVWSHLDELIESRERLEQGKR